MIERLVIGSTNPGKVNEWLNILGKDLKVLSLLEFDKLPEPQETGKTFRENARMKAGYYASFLKEFVLSEDGGFEIDALGGAPGIKSRRILPGDKEGTDEQLIEYVFDKMKDLPLEKRTARLTTAVAVADPKGKIIYEDKASFKGIVPVEPGQVLIQGYPFRSILFVPELNKTYSEMTPEEHRKFSHKRQIARRLVKYLLK